MGRTRAEINVATWRPPTVAGRASVRKRTLLRGTLYPRPKRGHRMCYAVGDLGSGAFGLVSALSTGGELFNWLASIYDGWLINWSGRHYFN